MKKIKIDFKLWIKLLIIFFMTTFFIRFLDKILFADKISIWKILVPMIIWIIVFWMVSTDWFKRIIKVE
jgi:hypothetical protein